MTPNAYCDHCKQMREYDVVTRTETYAVKGDAVTVDASVALCRVCGLEISIEELDDATLQKAYGIYRARHGLLQPEEIRSIRSMYGLGQKAFSKLLGWGEVTLARYEGGSIQSASHDQVLRLVHNPANVAQILARGAEQLTGEQRNLLEVRLQELSTEHEGLLVREEAAVYAAGPSVRKLREMIVYFAAQPLMWRTKLNKMLFYSDFLNWRRFAAPISGCRYVHMQFGPVPSDFYALQGSLVEDTSISECPVQCGECDGTVFVASRPADTSVFTPQELAVMAEVAGMFADWTASQVSEFSHREPAWLETKDNETIPYEYAARLQIS
ncbi:MAG: type II TA system antitoxin MqsA family protein [Coriobacteriia bacterium]